MLAILVLAAPLLAADAAAAAAPAGLTLDEAIAEALAENPALRAARLARPVASSAVDVAKQRANPDLSLEATRDAPREARGLTFPIETAGKRGHRVDLARAAAGTGEGEIAASELLTRDDVRRAFYALCAAQRRVTEADALRGLAERTRAAAKDRFDSGAAPRLELLQAELGLAQAGNEADGAAAKVVDARAALNLLLGRPADFATAVTGDLADGTLPATDDAIRRAIASGAAVGLADRRIDEQRMRIALARAQEYPDVAVSGAVTHDAPGEFDWGWRAGLSLTLPVFHHRRAETRTEELSLTQLDAEREATVERIRGAIVSAASAASTRRTQYLRYRDEILPRGDEVEKMAEDAYRSGQTSLLAMIQTVAAVRDLRTKAIDAGLDYQNAVADLEAAIGAPLP